MKIITGISTNLQNIKYEGVSDESLEKNSLLIKEMQYTISNNEKYIDIEEISKVEWLKYKEYHLEKYKEELIKKEEQSKRNYRLYAEEKKKNIELKELLEKEKKISNMHKKEHYSIKNRKVVRILDMITGKR